MFDLLKLLALGFLNLDADAAVAVVVIVVVVVKGRDGVGDEGGFAAVAAGLAVVGREVESQLLERAEMGRSDGSRFGSGG